MTGRVRGLRPRVVRWAVLVLSAVLVAATVGQVQSAGAADDAFVAVDHADTQGTPVPGAYLTADLGAWSAPPDPGTHRFQWLRDGDPVEGATARDDLVQPGDVGHVLAPVVTAARGAEAASFVGSPLTVRRIASSLALDVRRVQVAPDRKRRAWTALADLATERPWVTDGATVTAFKVKDGRLKALASAPVTRGAAFVRLPWREAPRGRTRVTVCFAGSDAVDVSCSPYVVVRRPR